LKERALHEGPIRLEKVVHTESGSGYKSLCWETIPFRNQALVPLCNMKRMCTFLGSSSNSPRNNLSLTWDIIERYRCSTSIGSHTGIQPKYKLLFIFPWYVAFNPFHEILNCLQVDNIFTSCECKRETSGLKGPSNRRIQILIFSIVEIKDKIDTGVWFECLVVDIASIGIDL
jgi:hypothetical protein